MCRGKTKINISFPVTSLSGAGCRNATLQSVAVKTQSKKRKKVLVVCRRNRKISDTLKSVTDPFTRICVCRTRFLEFLAGVLSKGVWWMPRLKKAMKDAA